MRSNRSLYAYEDEPYWTMCAREYVIPAFVFVSLAYYLVFHVLWPMRHINRPTRRTETEVLAAEANSVSDGCTHAPEAPSMDEKKEK
ncbi:hypothetical protein ABL78_2000 [Leptomonas seymouri]|uniref:Uncharacterized protein n=1 Tax=Leptomonas seymouri TaxID=5684 RepID=A0A0N1PDN5_LEPSE|nr:hypothetical protein ABL78_2000 [Leptomonas seymouri]|eukprot:KPI88883.1 hypothetical protein ABL78_2000 [Leptomonas seymouri]